jgi:hypothetical protein
VGVIADAVALVDAAATHPPRSLGLKRLTDRSANLIRNGAD